jgi:hypothetical protein
MIETTPRVRLRPDAVRPTERLKARLIRRRVPLAITTVVSLGCLAVLLLLLSVNHTAGGEVDGPEVALFGIIIGILSFVSLAVPGRRRVVLAALLVLWTFLAISGVAGYTEHSKAVTPASADQRQRPPLAPLVFTAFGIVGAGALILAYRGPSRPKS